MIKKKSSTTHKASLNVPGNASCNEVRILAGSLRGRKLVFKKELFLRPTPNRVRETLFNWLAPSIRNATCLDLFAGSGALSFEAVSRGAKKVIALEQNLITTQTLRKHAVNWNLQNLDIIHTDSRLFLRQDPTSYPSPFDIVFLDPPYQSNLLFECFGLLNEKSWIKTGALIYFESDKAVDPDKLPSAWEIIRSKKAGQVFFYLATLN